MLQAHIYSAKVSERLMGSAGNQHHYVACGIPPSSNLTMHTHTRAAVTG